MTASYSPKQRLVLSWWKSGEYDAILCDGAVRSGKTHCLTIGFFAWAMECFSGRAFALCGKSIGSVRRTVMTEALPWLAENGAKMKKLRGQRGFELTVGKRSNSFYYFGGNNEGSAALIQGMTLAGVLLDEAALMPQSFVEQACARCSVEGAKLWLCCNPEGTSHWLYRQWIEKAEEKRLLRVPFTMADNPALSAAVRRRYERQYSGVFYRRFVLGEWSATDGRVYDFFTRECAVEPPPECEKWYIACDYGTVNPLSLGLWGLYRGVWYRVAEVYYDSRKEGRQKTDSEYAELLRGLAGGRSISGVVVDPSAASFAEVLRRAGWRVIKGKNDVLSGIRVTADLLRSGKIAICKGCSALLWEIDRYVWDDGERVCKRDDHAMDEMRYFAATVAAAGSGAAACAVRREEVRM